jgi:RimJ/RimL family protein N-acetyltransferase
MTSHKFVVSLQGEFIRLILVIESDAEYIYKLRTSKSAEFLNCPPNYSIESQRGWIKTRPSTEINYMIFRNDTFMPVGMIGIYDCDWTNGVSNVGRLILEDQYVQKGSPYGLEALKICYGYVFNEMGFRKISGTINTKNDKVYRLQTYLGMTDEGCFKDHVLLNGEPQSLHFLSLFKEDFKTYSDNIDKLLDKYRK